MCNVADAHSTDAPPRRFLVALRTHFVNAAAHTPTHLYRRRRSGLGFLCASIS